MTLRKWAEEREASPVNGEAETHHREAGEDSDENRKDQEEGFFIEHTFEEGEHAARALWGGVGSFSHCAGSLLQRLKPRINLAFRAAWLEAAPFQITVVL